MDANRSIIPKRLIFGDYSLRKMRQRPVCSDMKFLQVLGNYLIFQEHGWHNPFYTITYFVLLVDTTLVYSEQHITIVYYWIWISRAHDFNSICKTSQSDYFGLIWDYRKMTKWFVLSNEGQELDPATQTGPLKPKWSIFGDHG